MFDACRIQVDNNIKYICFLDGPAVGEDRAFQQCRGGAMRRIFGLVHMYASSSIQSIGPTCVQVPREPRDNWHTYFVVLKCIQCGFRMSRQSSRRGRTRNERFR